MEASFDIPCNEQNPFLDVPRETIDRLQLYLATLKKWQKKINLVSPVTLDVAWSRHVADSAQLRFLIESDMRAVDIGSGAGLPGLVLAIMTQVSWTLIESDQRKAAFLQEAARITQTQVKILARRVEDCSLTDYSLLTARAFAPLNSLFAVLGDRLNPNHKLLLLKGKNYMSEIGDARRNWSFDVEVTPSLGDSQGVILSVTALRRKDAL